MFEPDNRLQVPDEDLVSGLVTDKTTNDCFSYYYYIHGEGANYIYLEIDVNGVKTELWSRQYSAGDMWHLNKITIPKQVAPFKVNFQCNFHKKFAYIVASVSQRI